MEIGKLKDFCKSMNVEFFHTPDITFSVEDITKDEFKNDENQWQYPYINIINWDKEQIESYFKEYM
jgi:hypothetical protein